MTNYFAEITGWGKCLPPAVLTNEDLSTIMETSDEWIRSRTGIAQRRISHVNTSELAYVAAQRALSCSGVDADEIDLIIIASCSADTLIPNIASDVQLKLGCKKAAAFDLNAACTGFLYGLETATRMVQAGNYRHAIIVGAERLSFYLDWTKRDTAVLFGDGAGAVVISRTEQKLGLQQGKIGCDPKGRDILAIPKFGTAMARFAADNGHFDFNFVGTEIFKRAVRGMSSAAKEVLSKSDLSLDDIALIIPHQANIRIIHTLCERFNLDVEKAFINIDKYGNTSAATIPIALCEAVEQGRVKPDMNILLAAFGAGLTWGAGHIKWGARVTPIAKSSVSLPHNEQSALDLIACAVAHCQANPS